ncbi:hypothetical protein ACQR1I_20350 [Bradyrhizobium sp. HKCCYLS2038]|uniref:hypothetical protein n=1 Tax=unclassified Bradyrhizobium TaxID=2631580 RepID=UPI003EB8301D
MVTIPHPKIAFGDLAERLKSNEDEVTIPRAVLNRLLDLYISFWDFDEEWYLATYPDVQAAVAQGALASGWAHFRAVGYFEGRLGYRPVVDSEWYLETYPDIAQAILEGKIRSAAEHFENFGYAEGRLPSDPGVDPKWYAGRYMNGAANGSANGAAHDIDARKVVENFVKIGYRQLAFPAPPR